MVTMMIIVVVIIVIIVMIVMRMVVVIRQFVLRFWCYILSCRQNRIVQKKKTTVDNTL